MMAMMAKKNQQLSEAEVLARMAGSFQKTSEKMETTTETATTSEEPVEVTVEYPEKEKEMDIHSNGNGKKNVYEEKFLKRVISGSFRSNVGITKDTLDIAERIIARLFDNKIAVSAYVDNILIEHFNKYKKDLDTWLAERPATIF